MTSDDYLKLVICIGVCELAGGIGALVNTIGIPIWYLGLHKPPLTPPGSFIGFVWVVLYLLMGVSLFFIIQRRAKRKRFSKRFPIALTLFTIQLVLNSAWSIIFFGYHNIGLALIDIILLWFSIALTIAVFNKIYKPAAYLLIPYIAWVTFATYLTYAIWHLNPFI